MIRHIILWKLNDDLTKEESLKIKSDIKESLEGLVGKIDGLLKMQIRTESLTSSSADLMMDSEFINEEALQAYQKHPAHLAVANGVVRPNVSIRLSMDYLE